MLITLQIGQLQTQSYSRFSGEFSRAGAINALKKPRAFLRGERRIKHTQWLYIVGELCCDTSSGQKQLLEDLHNDHPGMARMKNLARSYLWWPGLDAEIEDKVKSCKLCP